MGKDQQTEKAGVHDFCSDTPLNSGKKERRKTKRRKVRRRS